MSTSRYVGRHGNGRRGPLSRLSHLPSSLGSDGARAAAKTVAGVGIVLGSGAFVVAPSPAVGSESASGLASIDGRDTSLAAMLADRTADSSASRSALRSTVAITAPTRGRAKDVHESAGALALDPVVKPRPKPVEDEQRGAPGESRDAEQQDLAEGASPGADAQSQGDAASVSTDKYSSQAAALGLGANAQKVYSAVRTQFPDMTNIGGYRAGDGGDHGSGKAVDIMVSGSRGDEIAAWLQSNAGRLNITYLIWKQRIWMPGGSWKGMEDRGDPTQNHFDHVHVSVS